MIACICPHFLWNKHIAHKLLADNFVFFETNNKDLFQVDKTMMVSVVILHNLYGLISHVYFDKEIQVSMKFFFGNKKPHLCKWLSFSKMEGIHKYVHELFPHMTITYDTIVQMSEHMTHGHIDECGRWLSGEVYQHIGIVVSNNLTFQYADMWRP